MEYKEFLLKDLALKIGDGLHGTPSYDPKGDFYFVNGNNLEEGNIVIKDTTKTVNRETFEKYKKDLSKRTLLVSINGTIGKIAKFNNENIVLGKSACYINLNDTSDKNYIYFLLKSREFQNYIQQYATGTTIKNVSLKTIRNFKVKLPALKYQNKVSTILQNIENKIQLNYKMIANLQELSQTLFKRWFVDFEFPNENGNPYKSSGGEMVDSELGKIPKGWECVYLKDIVHHKKDTFNPKKSNESEVKHFSLPAFDSGQYPTIDNVTDIKSNKWIIDENCILFSKMNPTTRRIWVTSYNENFLNVASSEFVVLKSDNSYRNAFIYNICISDKFNEYLVSNTTGSTNSRQRVKPDIAVQYRFAYNEEVSYLLSEKIEPYIEKIKIIREQNQNLIQLRDTLLPKLMSGEIEIPDDIEVNEDELSI